MFASAWLSSLSSTSELSDLPEDEAVAPPAAAPSTTIVPDGPFASQPDLEAVKYLKDTSEHDMQEYMGDIRIEGRPQVLKDGWPGMILWRARLIIF